MLPFSLTSFLKYLIGVLFVQGVTVLLVVTAYRTDLGQTGLLFLLLNLAIGALTAFWFTSMAEGVRKQALSRAKEGFAREREKIRVRAEKEKTKEARSSRQQTSRELQRVRAGGNLKTGLLLGGAAGLGAVMVLTQFVTLGLLTLSTAGGGRRGIRSAGPPGTVGVRWQQAIATPRKAGPDHRGAAHQASHRKRETDTAGGRRVTGVPVMVPPAGLQGLDEDLRVAPVVVERLLLCG